MVYYHKIKFSHNYPKLHNQKTATLICYEVHHKNTLSLKFIEYDTKIEDKKHCPLPPCDLIVLTFIGNELIPFTTICRCTWKKLEYYKGAIGKLFKIEITEEAKNG